MAHKNIVKFICDCCKKEFDIDIENNVANKNYPLVAVEMPSKNYDCEGRHYQAGTAKVEICGKCFTAYWQYVQARYDVADYYGVTIKTVKEVR